MTGTLLAVLITLGGFSYAKLIFSGSIEGYSSFGFASAMISAVVIGLVVARGSSLPGIVAIPQDRVAPILALMALEITSSLPHDAAPEVAVLLVAASIAITTILTGAVLLLLGRLRLGNLLRFIPYPVVGGFLAASGWLLVRGGLQVLTHASPGTPLITWFAGASPLGWMTGLALALALALVVWRSPRPLLVPLTLAATVVVFYGISALAGTNLEELREEGLLAGVVPPLWELDFGWENMRAAPWGLLFQQSGLLATVLVTTFISILLSSSAIELLTRREADLNRELTVSGWGNLAAGALGGMVGFHSLSLSRFAISLGVPGRNTATIAALACAALIFAGPLFFGYLPNIVPGTLLTLLGLVLLLEWLVDGWRRLSRTDYAIVVLILATVAGIGYLEGVAVGTVAAVVLFVVKYSQVSVVNRVADGRQMRSNVERPNWHLEILEREGERIFTLWLRGYIFFGTAAEILAVIRMRQANRNRSRLTFVVLDFEGVTGFDSSAAVSLKKAVFLADKEQFRIAFCGLSPGVRRDLAAADLNLGNPPTAEFSDFDHALEWCEDTIIAGLEGNTGSPLAQLEEQLRHSWPRPDEAGRFLRYLERVEFSRGEELIRQGDPSESIFFVESGHVTARVAHANGRFTRLRRQGSGTVVGELGFYLRVARTASVVADSDGVAYLLRRSAMERLARAEPALESSLHHFMVRTLAARNAFINASVRNAVE